MTQYGIVIGENEARRAVEKGYRTDGVPTWEKAYQGAQDWRTSMLTGIAEQERAGIKEYGYTEARDIAETKYDYNQAIRDAYASTAKNDAAIMKSNLGQGYKNLYLGENQMALQEAYDSYRKSYLQQKSKIEEQSQIGIDSILKQSENATEYVEKTYQEQLEYLNESLAAEGKNISDLSSATFDYLQTLYDTMPELFDTSDIRWNKYKQYFNDEGKLDKTSLMSALTNYEEVKNEKGEVISYEPKWNEFGVDFFDQMLNYKGERLEIDGKKFDIPNFGAYLAGKNSDLLSWATAQNPWYTVTEGEGENAATRGKTGYQIFKELVGLDEGDDAYAFNERLGGLKDDELKAIFKDFKTWDDETKAATQAITSISDAEVKVKSLQDFVNKLGINKNNELSEYFDKLNGYVADIKNRLNKTDSEVIKNELNGVLNDIYKDAVDSLISYVPNIRKEHGKLMLDVDIDKLSNTHLDSWKNEFFNKYPNKIEPADESTWEGLLSNKWNGVLNTINEIWGSYAEYERDWNSRQKNWNNEKESGIYQYYEVDSDETPYYKDTYNSSYTALAQSGYLPANAAGYYGGNNISKREGWTLGSNLIVDGDEVEFQDYATVNPHNEFLLEYMPDNSFFAYVQDGKKRIIYKKNGNKLYTIGKVEKKVNGKSGQEMYDELFNKLVAHQHTSIQNSKNRAGTRKGRGKKKK